MLLSVEIIPDIYNCHISFFFSLNPNDIKDLILLNFHYIIKVS